MAKGRYVKKRNPLPLLILLTAALLLLALPWKKPTDPLFTPAADGSTLKIVAGGDINIGPELLKSAKRGTEQYDFGPMLLDTLPILSPADLSILDLEANFCPGTLDPELSQIPEALLQNLREGGIDVLQTANTASIMNGIEGLESTLSAVRKNGMEPVGTFRDTQEFRETKGFTLLEVQGFRVAIAAFTKGVGNLRLPSGSLDCVNLLYEDYSTTYQEVNVSGIQQVLLDMEAEQPDITIALLHWGSEFDREISRSQKTIQSLMRDGGVDVILGTHSHVVGPIAEEDGMLTAFSLGNFLSTQGEEGILLEMEFTKENGRTKLSKYTAHPIYLSGGDQEMYHLIDTEKALTMYESGYVGRVSEPLYETLLESREEIFQYLHPEEEH